MSSCICAKKDTALWGRLFKNVQRGLVHLLRARTIAATSERQAEDALAGGKNWQGSGANTGF